MSIQQVINGFDIDLFRAKTHFNLRHNSISSDNWEKAIADATGIKHESPQLLLYKDGQIVWHTSHGEISQASLKAAFLQYS